MWLSGIIAIINSNGDSASPWNIPLGSSLQLSFFLLLSIHSDGFHGFLDKVYDFNQYFVYFEAVYYRAWWDHFLCLFEYFDIVAGVLQGDTLAPYLFIICLDYVLRTSIDKIKENGFELTKKRSRRYPATTITDADYADDIAILANTPDQAETLLHSLERAAASIGLHVNAHKTEYMCYNQTGDISTLEGTPLKLVDKFTYLGSSVESTEKDIETRLTKAWTAINRLSTIWKSDLTDKMKRSFFQAAVTSILLYGCTTWTLTKRLEKKLDGNYTRMLRAILNKSWQQHPTRHQLYGHLPLSRNLFKSGEPDMQDIAGEAKMNS